MMSVPGPKTAIVLRDQHGGMYRSEVLQSRHNQLVLARPADEAGRPLVPGTRLLVTWPDDKSLLVLPVVLVDRQDQNGTETLITSIDGASWREERRQYARSAIAASLHIYFAGENPGDINEAAGELIDLSEVALRCVVSAANQALCRPRTPVSAEVQVDGDVFEIPGHVLLGKQTDREDAGLELVVLFDRPVPRVEELRVVIGELSKTPTAAAG